MPHASTPAPRTSRHPGSGVDDPRSWRRKLQTVLGYALLIAGIGAIANGGIEAAMGPRLEHLFGARSGETWPWIVLSFVVGVAALATGLGFLIAGGRKELDDYRTSERKRLSQLVKETGISIK